MWPRTSIRDRGRRFVTYDLPVLLYAGLIFWLSSQSYTEREKQVLDLVPDVFLHAIEYGILALLLLRQLYGSGRIVRLGRALTLSFLISVGYGISDEWHQSFVPQRQTDFRDGLADSVGAALFLAGSGVYLLKKKELTPQNRHDSL